MKLFDGGQVHATLAVVTALVAGSGCVAQANGDEVLDPIPNVNEAGMTLALCGTLDTFSAPRSGPPAQDGALSIDGHRWTVLAHATVEAADLLSPGEGVCIKATMDTDSRIERCSVSPRSR